MTTSISPQRRDELIDALRRGTVPMQSLDLLAVGLDRFADTLVQELESVQAGGAKFNVSTELKRTLIDAKYEYITANREEYDPGKVDEAVRKAIRDAVGHWIDMLGSADKA